MANESPRQSAGASATHNEDTNDTFKVIGTPSLHVATARTMATYHWTAHEWTWQQVLDWLDLDKPSNRKDCGGIVGGLLVETVDDHSGKVDPHPGIHRVTAGVANRTVVALDADYAVPSFVADAATELGCAMALYTTWSHTPEAPRWRLLAPLSRAVTPSEYVLIVTALMHGLGKEQFDHTTTQPERLMLRPSAQDRSTYARHAIDGPPLDADAWLARATALGLDAAPPVPERAGVAEVSPAYADLTPGQRAMAEEAVSALAESWRAKYEEALLWPEGVKDGKQRGWEQLARDGAWAFATHAAAGWTGLTASAAEALYLSVLPDEIATDPKCSGKWRTTLIAKAVRDGRVAEPPWGEWEPLSEDFWDATPVLAHIRQAAHSRLVSAPALLVYVLARVLLEVPPGVALPPVVGSRASLNLGFAVVGRAGAGKSVLLGASRELLGLVGEDQAKLERNLGSGEGLGKQFLRHVKGQEDMQVIDYPHRMFTVDEVDQMKGQGERSGSTMMSTLRTALTGGPLGQANATADRNRHVPAGVYRAVLVIGVQPTRSHTLLRDADAGTPQRLVWVSATDATIPDEGHDVDWPGPLDWSLPDGLPDVLDYPDHIKTEVRAARRAAGKEGAADLKGHMLLTRLKVGAALTFLHEEVYLSEQWWTLAGTIVDASMAIQEGLVKQLGDTEQEGHNRAAIVKARAEDAADEDRVRRVAQLILGKLRKARGEWVATRDFKPEPKLRPYVRAALEALVASGDAEVEDYINSRGTGARRARYVGRQK